MSLSFDGVRSDRRPWKNEKAHDSHHESNKKDHHGHHHHEEDKQAHSHDHHQEGHHNHDNGHHADEKHEHKKKHHHHSENKVHASDRERLLNVAAEDLADKKFVVGFSSEIAQETENICKSFTGADQWLADGCTEDLREVLFVSIDNDDTLDIDQLQTAYYLNSTSVIARIAVADVASFLPINTLIDQRAKSNTATCYTPALVNSMIPEELSHGITSLNEHEDRMAIVVDFVITGIDFSKDVEEIRQNFQNAVISEESVRSAVVRNHAKLAYPSVGAWLEGTGPLPPAVGNRQEIIDSLILQDKVAQLLLEIRRHNGALEFRRSEFWVVFEGDKVTGMIEATNNRATSLIENFMVQANGIVSRYLSAQGKPTIQRVVEDPKKWDAIVQFAKTFDFTLPDSPDNVALRRFLADRQAKDPNGFSDLSLTVIKLMGRGKYLFAPIGEGQHNHGHFGLAVHDYTHSTAPNRRFPDLATQRILLSVLKKKPFPYTDDDLMEIAEHCSLMEDEASKVERKTRKAAGAILLKKHIGELFDAVVTGTNDKGTWVRIEYPPVEGKIVKGDCEKLSISDRVRVKLVCAHVEKALIDFELANSDTTNASSADDVRSAAAEGSDE